MFVAFALSKLPPVFTSMHSPIGYLSITGDSRGIQAISFQADDPGESAGELPTCLLDAKQQLAEYFAGQRRQFELQLAPKGTDFQMSVWDALLEIPFGVVRSYKDVALQLENEKAFRAVGAANGENPIAVVIPCHRVVASNGDLTGYAGELWRKKWLLEHEHSMEYGKQGSLF
jgi:methylated-DNA-[protein]-cysteine S-methyltransferase